MIDIAGKQGTVTVGIRGGGRPGEVLVRGAGSSQTYIAYCDEPVDRGEVVVVLYEREGRAVDVAPTGGGG